MRLAANRLPAVHTTVAINQDLLAVELTHGPLAMTATAARMLVFKPASHIDHVRESSIASLAIS